MEAIVIYKKLLGKRDPIEPNRNWLLDDRDTLYRRVIRYEYKFEGNENKAGEWIIKAWDEGLRDLRFQAADEDVKEFWTKTTDALRQKNKARKRPKKNDSEPDGKFDRIPGLDNARLDRSQHELGWQFA